jgi:hypothetical protein
MKLLSVEVKGVGFNQNKGKLLKGDLVSLERVPQNRVHCNAIAVMDPSGKRAGWVPRDMADILSPAMLSGEFRVLRSVAQSKSNIDIYFEGDMRGGGECSE